MHSKPIYFNSNVRKVCNTTIGTAGDEVVGPGKKKKYYYKPLKKLTHIHFRLIIDSASAPNRQTQRRNWAKMRSKQSVMSAQQTLLRPKSYLWLKVFWTGATSQSQSYNSTKMSFRICFVWRWSKCIVRRSFQADRPHNAHRFRPKARRQCNFVFALESNRISRERRLCLRNQCPYAVWISNWNSERAVTRTLNKKHGFADAMACSSRYMEQRTVQYTV